MRFKNPSLAFAALVILSGCVSISGNFDLTPSIHLSATTGDMDEVNTYLHDGIDVNEVDEERDTALVIAARWGYIDIVRLLLENGADPNIQNIDLDTAIGEVSLVNNKNDVEIVSLLLQHGADPNISNSDGDSALHRFMFSNKRALDISKLLLAQGADPDLANDLGQTAIHVAMDSRHRLKNAHAIINLLLDTTSDVNLIDNDGWSALDYICDDNKSSSFDYDIAARLVGMGINVSAGDYIAIEDCERNNKKRIAALLRDH